MPIALTDAQISDLLAERKPLPPDYRRRLKVKPKRGHKEVELSVSGSKGSTFRLSLWASPRLVGAPK